MDGRLTLVPTATHPGTVAPLLHAPPTNALLSSRDDAAPGVSATGMMANRSADRDLAGGGPLEDGDVAGAGSYEAVPEQHEAGSKRGRGGAVAVNSAGGTAEGDIGANSGQGTDFRGVPSPGRRLSRLELGSQLPAARDMGVVLGEAPPSRRAAEGGASEELEEKEKGELE